MGLRSLAPSEPGYVGTYAGSSAARDAAYHQGTVWPWLHGGLRGGVAASASGERVGARRGGAPLRRADPRAPPRGRHRPRVGDCRRRRAVDAAGLPVPGVVVGRVHPPRATGGACYRRGVGAGVGRDALGFTAVASASRFSRLTSLVCRGRLVRAGSASAGPGGTSTDDLGHPPASLRRVQSHAPRVERRISLSRHRVVV